MLERRAGEDLFRRQVGNLVAAACEAPPGRTSEACLVSAMAFIGELGRLGEEALMNGGLQTIAGRLLRRPERGRGSVGTGRKAPLLYRRGCCLSSATGDLRRIGDFKKEVAAFAERWIYGRGVSQITAGFVYHK